MERSENIRQLCQQFIAGTSPCYVFGTTPYAADICQHVKIDGFIDDYSSATHFHDIPVIKLSAVPDNAIVVSAIIDGRPVTINRLLREHGIRNIDYFSFKKYTGLPLTPLKYGMHADFSDRYLKNRSKFDAAYALLSDDLSRETFKRLVAFRLSEDIRELEFFDFRLHEMYFESWINLSGQGPVFVDVGCFDGETTLEFIRRYPDYKSVHLFEPEPDQMSAIRAKLAGIRDIHYHQCGTSNKKETLRFTSSGSWSHLDENGEIVVEVDTLDARVNEKASFIKMDVEGYEYATLEGARQHILNDHPILAISAYHLVDDFWRIPELVLSMRNDYQVFMRHYCEGILETVYYFVPVNAA